MYFFYNWHYVLTTKTHSVKEKLKKNLRKFHWLGALLEI